MGGDEGPKVRLFVGFRVPSVVAEALDVAIEPWRRAFPQARWVPPVDWHVTLKFLGATTPARAEWVGARLRELAADISPLRVRLTDLGCFPSPDRARVLWVGMDDRAGRLAELALSVDAALATAFAPESRLFAPHLTLARCPRPVALPASYPLTPIPTPPFVLESVTLFRSAPDRPPPRYEAMDVLAFEHLFE